MDVGVTVLKKTWKKEKSDIRKRRKNSGLHLHENQTHDLPSSSLDALTNEPLEALWPAGSKLDHQAIKDYQGLA